MTSFADRLSMALAADQRHDYEVAGAAGVDKTQLSRWKRGRAMPDLSSVMALLEELHVSGHWLLTGQGDMHPDDPDAEREAFRQIVAIVEKFRSHEDRNDLGDVAVDALNGSGNQNQRPG